MLLATLIKQENNMKDIHKECRMCKQTLELNMFKDVRKKNESGEYKYYKNSYCGECEIKRQAKYNKTRARPEGVLSWDEYVKQKAQSKKKRLERLAIEKEQRKIEREKLKQEKIKLKEEQKKLNIEAGKAKWEDWYSKNKDRMKEEYRKKAEQEREARLATGVKVCSTCKKEKPLSEYHMRNRKRKDNSVYQQPYSSCKECRRDNDRYYKNTPNGKILKRNNSRLRDKRNRQATPKWLNKEQRKEIIDTYNEMRELNKLNLESYHVDHIIPIRGESICGLHVPWNLRVIKASDNMSKSNNITESIYTESDVT